MAKVNYRKLTIEAIEEVGADVQEGTPEFEAAVRYLTEYWDMANDKSAAKELKMKVKDYALNSIGNGIQDGNHLDFMEEEPAKVEPSEEDDNPKGQEIIEVDQDEVKRALKVLVTRENAFLAYLYDMHEEYNEQYFYGQLSRPFITIDKLSNKTLGNYTHGEDAMGITNHIRFNRNFIALNQGEDNNDPTRILETLRHEMIHQWQDEVLYMQEGVAAREIILPVGFGSFLNPSDAPKVVFTKDGKPKGEKAEQKKRPKEWHNRDFKEYAVVVDIPAKGDKCYGNPANMPQGKSYNRKFTCECVASNGHQLTIWSTRDVDAHCNVCDTDFVEQEKEGEIIPVVLSNVEAPGEDAMEIKAKKKGYAHFAKFPSKKERDAFVDVIYSTTGEDEALEVEQGFYMKGNNAYKEGFTHWVAYNGDAVPEPGEKPKAKNASKDAKPLPKVAPVKKAVEKAKAKLKTPEPEPQVEVPVEKPKAPKKPKPLTKKQADKKKNTVKKPEPQPEPIKLTIVPDLPKEEPKVETPAEDVTIIEYSHENPEHLLELYKKYGSVKKVAEHFGMTAPNIIYHAKKHGVDFKKGVILDGAKA